MRIYVGNLEYSVNSDDLRSLFEPYGEVTDAEVQVKTRTGQSRGFGLVEMPNESEAEAAIQALNGQDHQGRALTVNESRPGAPCATCTRAAAGTAADPCSLVLCSRRRIGVPWASRLFWASRFPPWLPAAPVRRNVGRWNCFVTPLAAHPATRAAASRSSLARAALAPYVVTLGVWLEDDHG